MTNEHQEAVRRLYLKAKHSLWETKRLSIYCFEIAEVHAMRRVRDVLGIGLALAALAAFAPLSPLAVLASTFAGILLIATLVRRHAGRAAVAETIYRRCEPLLSQWRSVCKALVHVDDRNHHEIRADADIEAIGTLSSHLVHEVEDVREMLPLIESRVSRAVYDKAGDEADRLLGVGLGTRPREDQRAQPQPAG